VADVLRNQDPPTRIPQSHKRAIRLQKQPVFRGVQVYEQKITRWRLLCKRQLRVVLRLAC
jgi:hypothetical protein